MNNNKTLLLSTLSALMVTMPALAGGTANYLVQESLPQDLSPSNPAGMTPKQSVQIVGAPVVAVAAEAVPVTAPVAQVVGAPVVTVVAEAVPVTAPVAQVVAPAIATTPLVVSAPATVQIQTPAVIPAVVQVQAPAVIPAVVQVQAPVALPTVVQEQPQVVMPAVVQAPVVMPATIQVQAPALVSAPLVLQGPVLGAPVFNAPTARAYTTYGSPVISTQSAHSYWGYVYPGNSILVTSPSFLRTNMDGTVYAHPSFPGRNLFWNQNEDRWCYQDASSSTGWRFVPAEIRIGRPN